MLFSRPCSKLPFLASLHHVEPGRPITCAVVASSTGSSSTTRIWAFFVIWALRLDRPSPFHLGLGSGYPCFRHCTHKVQMGATVGAFNPALHLKKTNATSRLRDNLQSVKL